MSENGRQRRAELATVVWAAVPLLAAAASGPLIGFASRAGYWWPLPLFGGIALGLIAIAIQVAVKTREARQKRSLEDERDAFRQVARDALMPVATLLAEMPNLDLPRRLEHLRTVATAAVSALYLLISPHAARARANVYILETHPDQMVWLAHVGRGEKPGPFVAGTPRGDAALAFVAAARSTLYVDLGAEQPPGYEGTASGYRTFLAVPIFIEGSVFGMVTVDAPDAGTLTEGDLSVAELVAEMLSVAFASAEGIEPAHQPNVSG